MKVLVWGAGAIGGTIGAHLAHAGHDVTFVDKVAEHVAAIRNVGLEISGPVSQFAVRASAFLPEGLPGRFRTVLLCTKAHDTVTASRSLLPHLASDGCVVSVQNGLNEPIIAGIVGAERTVGCFINFGADYQEPGHILYGGRGAVVLGEIDGRMTPRVRELHLLFRDFDDRAITTDNIFGYLWGKMAYGALLFVTALCDDSMADALANLSYRDVYIRLAIEVLSVATAAGVRPEGFNGFDPAAFGPGAPRSAAERSVDDMAEFNRHSAKTHSGIWRDIAVRRRKTESIELEQIIEVGDRTGVPTPVTATLLRFVHDVEDGRRPQSLGTLDALKEALG